MYQPQSETPIYFKIPTSLKEEFDVVCKRTKTTKTSKLYDFIKDYVETVKIQEPNILELEPNRQWTVKSKKLTDPLKGMWGR